MRNAHRQRGLSMIETALAVSMLGILLAVGVPSFLRYTEQGKTVEAARQLQRLHAAEHAYYAASAESGPRGIFVAARPLPGVPTAQRFPANAAVWTGAPDWAALGFSIEHAHFYRYEVQAPTPGEGFTAVAQGDLNGNGNLSTFARTTRVRGGELVAEPLRIVSELE